VLYLAENLVLTAYKPEATKASKAATDDLLPSVSLTPAQVLTQAIVGKLPAFTAACPYLKLLLEAIQRSSTAFTGSSNILV